jgi:hypothetical protein
MRRPELALNLPDIDRRSSAGDRLERHLVSVDFDKHEAHVLIEGLGVHRRAVGVSLSQLP